MKMTANACECQQTKSSKAMSVFFPESHGTKTENNMPNFEGDPADGDLEGLEALGLTRRQAQVAFWIAQGKTNDDPAIILNTSRHTIPWGCTFAETPLNAISRSQLEPRVSRSEVAVQKRLVRMVPGSARNWIAVNAVRQSKRNETKNDNSTCKKFA
jgi:DNA-binding CsgD family transcriptional regulator